MEAPPTSKHGPYPPTTATVGGVPAVTTDIPICAVFLSLFVGFAVTNQVLYHHNRRRHHHFFISLALFGFCMARIATLTLRIGWATRLHNVRLAIASQIFANAGILVVYVVNLVLARRILRAKRPRIGGSRLLEIIHKVLYVAIVIALALVITAVVWSVYTLDKQDRTICRDIQLAAITFLLTFTTLPIWYLIACFVLPKEEPEENFGRGSLRAKMIIVTISTLLSVLIAGFKAGTAWSPPRPVTEPAWYDSKASYYLFSFTLEIFVISTLVGSRIDQRFYIPSVVEQEQQRGGEHKVQDTWSLEKQEVSITSGK